MILNIKRSVFLAVSLFAIAVQAAPQVELNILIEKELSGLNEKGENVIQRVEVTEVAQGETLFYTIQYKNSGDEAATDVQLNNPIAEGSTYVANSAWGNNSTIQFTINGSEYLTAEEMNNTASTAADYTAIRWLVSEIKPGTEGQVGFSTKID